LYLALKAGATLYKLQIDMNIKTSQDIKVGDKVTFDNDKIEVFKAETNLDNKEIQQYRKLVLAGIDQVGVVKDLGVTMTTVAYSDGWELPIPTKYLIVLPEAP
jgi:hypothetical protein